MERKRLESSLAFILACVIFVLMCVILFDTEKSHAAVIAKGKTSKKVATVKVKLSKGMAVVRIKNGSAIAYSQIQSSGGTKLGNAIGESCIQTKAGKSGAYGVPVKSAGTYYLYINSTATGTSYNVRTYPSGGTLKNKKTKVSTSYGDDKSVVYYKFKASKKGKLRVTVTDASPQYKGYSKVRLKKGKTLISGEESLIEGYGYSTVYGISKGTYKIGVRSSSDLYRIKATFKKVTTLKAGKSKKKAVPVKIKTSAKGIVTAGNTTARWYKITIPKKSADKKKAVIKMSSSNNNFNVYSGIYFTVYYDKISRNSTTGYSKMNLINNETVPFNLAARKGKKRVVYVKVVGSGQTSGVYSIKWQWV